MRLDSYVFSSPGGRACNEDAAGCRIFPGGGLFVLADGLGGHRNGALASGRVVESLLDAAEPGTEAHRKDWLRGRLEDANQAILALQTQTHSNLRSTAVVLTIQGRCADWAHVGDSRLYYLHQARLCAVTEDHSVAYRKYRAGEITKAQIARDPDQPALLRALGNPSRSQADLGAGTDSLEPGDGFLLCSDGVWEYLRDEEILADLLKSDTAQAWAEDLLLRVMERLEPENDNLSLITVLVQEQ